MAKYVDGFVITIPKKNLPLYKEMAKVGKKVWLKHGALEYMECVGEDLKPKSPDGQKVPSFLSLTGAKPTETVMFSFIVFKSRKHRDQVNAKVMKDPEMNNPEWGEKMPFDMQKMTYGGFELFV